MARTHEEPSDVIAHLGDVIVDGPGPVAIALSPQAAIDTGERLIEAGVHARGQRITGQTHSLS